MLHDKIKILLVSDAVRFALTDVYYGYHHALTQLKIPFEPFPHHLYRKILSDECCYHIIHSTALIKSKEFTHVMIVGGLNAIDFIMESLYHVKSIVVSTEDPHSIVPMQSRMKTVDYYFSNERSVAQHSGLKNVYYCPTAGSTHECGKLVYDRLEEKYKSDILFLGAVYPNRAKYLEALIPLVEKHGLNFKVCGHANFLSSDAPLRKYVFDNRTIPHKETVDYYNGAKIVINIMRDVTWNPFYSDQSNPFNNPQFKAESLNPRAYEVPLCQAFMVMDDSRPEAREVYAEDEVGFFSDEKSLVEVVEHYLLGPGQSKREEMAFKAYRKASENHTYVHRLKHILATIDPPASS